MPAEPQQSFESEDRVSHKACDSAAGDLACNLWQELAHKSDSVTPDSGDLAATASRDGTLDFQTAALYGDSEPGQLLKTGSGDSTVAAGSPAERTGDANGDRAGERTAERQVVRPADDPAAVRREYERINDLAKLRITNPEELQRFRQDMVDFEVRALEQKMPPEEIARTYQQISRLLESDAVRPTTAQERVAIAEQVMHQAAHPDEINQGLHATCNVAVLESRIYSRNPSEASRLVADVALAGVYETANGKLIKPGEGSLKPDWEARTNPPKEGERSYASQIFQMTAVNLYWEQENGKSSPRGQIRYEQLPEKAPGDSGERLVDYSKNPPSEVARAPRVHLSGLADVSEQITGKRENDLVIVSGAYEDRPGYVKVESPDALRDLVAQMKREGRLPAVLPVWSSHEPFLTDAGRLAGGDITGGGHVVTIKGYDERTGRVLIDNQFGRESDRSLTLDETYRAMFPAESRENIAAIRTEVERNRESGRIDTFKELDLARLEHLAGKNGDAAFADRAGDLRFDQELVRIVSSARERWQAQKDAGTYNPEDERRAMEKVNNIINNYPKPRRMIVKAMLSDKR